MRKAYRISDISIVDNEYRIAMAEKLALQGFVDLFRDAFLVTTTTSDPRSTILTNK